jgi:SAM-dependent methyltransferase
MSLYERFVLPRVVDFACAAKPAMRQRAKIVPAAQGRVLEIGFGSGLNLPFYDPDRVEHLWALEPSPRMWQLASERVGAARFPVEFVEASADAIPLPDRSADTVLVTYTMCTLPDVVAALGEVDRLLKPGGRLLFCEHGEAPDPGVRRWQRRLNPVWSRLAGGCHLDRPIPSILEGAGFRLRNLSTMYLPGFRPATFNFWGSAAPVRRSRPSRPRVKEERCN